MKVLFPPQRMGGWKSFCSWERLLGSTPEFNVQPDEEIVAIEVNEQGLSIVVEVKKP